MLSSTFLDSRANIKFYLRENDRFVCKLFIDNSRLLIEYSKDFPEKDRTDLSAYLEKNIPQWEKEEFFIPVYDNVAVPKFKITDPDPQRYLFQIYIRFLSDAKEKIFSMKYIISNEKSSGLNILKNR